MALPHFSLSPLFRQTWIPFFPCPCAATLPFFLYLSVSPAHIPRGAVPAPGFLSLCYTLYSSLHWGLHGDPAHSVVSHHLTLPPNSHGPSLLLCLLFCQFPTACPCFPGNNVSVSQTTMSFHLRHTGLSAPWDSTQRVLCATQGCELLALPHWCC